MKPALLLLTALLLAPLAALHAGLWTDAKRRAEVEAAAHPAAWMRNELHFDLPEVPQNGAMLTVCIAATRGGARSIQCNDTKLPVRQIIEGDHRTSLCAAPPPTAVPTTSSARKKSNSIPVISMRAETCSRCNSAAARIPSRRSCMTTSSWSLGEEINAMTTTNASQAVKRPNP